MKFGLNQMGFPFDSVEDNIRHAARAGYDGVELSLTEDGALGDPEALAEYAEMAAEYGVDIPSVVTPHFWEYPLSSRDVDTRKYGMEVGSQLIVAASELGAETVLVVPGVVDEATRYDVAYEQSLSAVRDLAKAADQYDVTLAVENVWNKMLLSPREFAEFVDDASDAGPVGAYFDVGNVLRYGYPDQWIQILGDRIEAVHVKDYDEDIDTLDGFTYPLQGDVDWDAVVAALDDIGYDGWVSAEVPPYEHHGEQMPRQVLANLRNIFEG